MMEYELTWLVDYMDYTVDSHDEEHWVVSS